MRKIVPIALASAVMTACVGPVEDTDSSSAGNISSATQQTSSSQMTVSSTPPVSSSSVAPASSSQGATSSQSGGGESYSDYNADALKGAELYRSTEFNALSCANSNCHGENLSGIDLTLRDQNLFEIIRDEMPAGAAAKCVGECAANITAYILSWAQSEGNKDVACSSDDAITYSPRALKLLAVNEYQNTIEDLLGFDEDIRSKLVIDSTRGGFPNNAATNVDPSRADKYWELADYVATWAIENGKPFDCTAGCSGEFIDELLPRLFRRPITEAERTQYEEILAGDPKMAFVAALTAPQFLYRSELGKKVSEVLSTEPESYYRPDPDSQVVSTLGGDVGEDGYIFAGYYIGESVDYNWTGNDIISFQVRAEASNGSYPSITFAVEGFEQQQLVVTSDRPQTFRINVKGVSGNPHVKFNPQPNKVWISPLTFGAAVLYTPSRGDEEKMKRADPDSYVLDPFEYASVLSYALTGSAPDDALWEAASNDGLHYDDQVRAHVERLIDSPRGRKHMGEMANYWFKTHQITEPLWDRDTAIFPNYTPEVRKSMVEEVRELFREVFYNERPFESFYGGDYTVVNKALSDYYEITSGASSNDDWRVVEGLDKRGGMLTSGAFMTLHAHAEKTRPIIRAVRVREDMLCQHILPPATLEVSMRAELIAKANEDFHAGISTVRKYNEDITNDSSCDACHEYQINPLFGMEDFDQVGKWRTEELTYDGMSTNTIDASGKLYGPIDIGDNSEANAIEYYGAKELSKAIATLPGVEKCLVDKSFRFVAGLPITDDSVDKVAQEPYLTSDQKASHACVIDDAKSAYESSGHSARAVITELVMQDLMRYRK